MIRFANQSASHILSIVKVRHTLSRMLRCFGSAVTILLVCALSVAQSGPRSDGDAHPSKLVVPAYPAIARAARIEGDMDLTLLIGPGGQVISATIDRGPALLVLRQAVLEAARESRFDCKSRDQKPQAYSLRYHFETKPIDPEKYCHTYGQLDPPPAVVDIIQGQVSVYEWEEYTCDPAVQIRKIRSLKCRYLWKCGLKERTLE